MRLSEHTKLRKEQFGTVVFDTLTEKIFVTDQIGSEILQLVEQEKDLPQIISELAEMFDADEKVIEKDVVDFTNELISSNIISEQEQA